MTNDRAQDAYAFRVAAADVSRHRTHPTHTANPDEQRYASACYPMSFTKGLEHDEHTGLVAKAADFEAFRAAIDSGLAEPFTTRVPVPLGKTRRQWEAPTAGLVHDLQGPDAQAVTMPPAPALCSDELTFEMAEVYELALLRDTPFYAFDHAGGPGSADLTKAVKRLNTLPYAVNGFPGRGRATEGDEITRQTAFRGSSPGCVEGPYISQFLLVGNLDQNATENPDQGYITYGAQTIDQRVLEAEEGDDYLMKWADWLHVQRGFAPGSEPSQNFTGKRRFIHTPRDLATYVHFDALYQAYLNACLILLGNGAPFDPAFDLLSGSNGHEILIDPHAGKTMPVNAGGFALWGGPHILSLVTEVATRALKAVRYQKFNTHLRLRPEALAARVDRAHTIDEKYPSTCCAFTKMHDDLSKTLKVVNKHNLEHPNGGEDNVLLPMAFAEGSPMHPTYGAGHATVAGACVTMLKAFFDTSALFARITAPGDEPDRKGVAQFYSKGRLQTAYDQGHLVEYGAYEVKNMGGQLDFQVFDTACHTVKGKGKAKPKPQCPLTLEGELNKLAANISIGRNMAGVHYYSDYFDSARMGEEIALGILEEQALGYPTDRFVLSVPTFDGDMVRIGNR